MTRTRSDQEWLKELTALGPIQESAIADLRELLLRAALYFFSRNLGDFRGPSRDDLLQRAEDCAQDALLAVLNHLSDFRGDSKFSTWAYKFAINTAMVASRRERWKGISLDELASADEGSLLEKMLQEISGEMTPETSAMQAEVQRVIGEVIRRDLTDRQREVLVLMIFQEVPLDEVARHMRTNRNAVYKLLHDARRKLKRGLEQHGFQVSETLSLFGPPR
jgi:RNA polymerase sigma-70 factor, ECF subfamily